MTKLLTRLFLPFYFFWQIFSMASMKQRPAATHRLQDVSVVSIVPPGSLLILSLEVQLKLDDIFVF